MNAKSPEIKVLRKHPLGGRVTAMEPSLLTAYLWTQSMVHKITSAEQTAGTTASATLT